MSVDATLGVLFFFLSATTQLRALLPMGFPVGGLTELPDRFSAGAFLVAVRFAGARFVAGFLAVTFLAGDSDATRFDFAPVLAVRLVPVFRFGLFFLLRGGGLGSSGGP